MKLRVIDLKRGIVKIDLSELAESSRKKKKEGEDIRPPLLWMPPPERHDPEGRNKR